MLEIICKKCDTVHRYEISDNCSKCESSFNELMNPPKKKGSYKLVAALFGITFMSGVVVDNVVFDSDNNVQANPEEIYVLYNSMSQCIARQTSNSTGNVSYSEFAKKCSQVIGKK